jgi:tartrate-resistant acid phosphatase type 5
MTKTLSQVLFAFTIILCSITTVAAQKKAKTKKATKTSNTEKITNKTSYLLPTTDESGYVGYQIKDLEVVKNKTINFLVVGDWGRNGQFKQTEVADRMGEAARQLDAQFVISTGDNFYLNGIASVEDPAWQSSFEQVYTAHSLMVDWYPVLGNHDYRGNPDAEIAYSKRSRRWNMPARYYSVEKNIGRDGKEKVLLVFLDTSPFEAEMYHDKRNNKDLFRQDTAAQKKWLDSLLTTSQAKWKIVVGHHPLYTSGPRINSTQSIIAAFDNVLEKHKIDAYFAGHEHDLQHQQPTNKFTHHFVSGAGSEKRPTGTAPMTKFSASAHGFMAVSLQETKLLLQVIDEQGKILYKTTIEKP